MTKTHAFSEQIDLSDYSPEIPFSPGTELACQSAAEDEVLAAIGAALAAIFGVDDCSFQWRRTARSEGLRCDSLLRPDVRGSA